MTLDPILAAPPATQVHILLTLVALVATALILPLRKSLTRNASHDINALRCVV